VVERDAVGNVLIRKAGHPGPEGRPTTCLQAHVDMVCEKNEDTAHDFTKDPIQLVQDGDLLRAKGTTLGADNGIGVCRGPGGAGQHDHPPRAPGSAGHHRRGDGPHRRQQPPGGWLKAKYLLNLDSEEEGYLTIGCAGGVDTIATPHPHPRPAPGRARRPTA
jgi:dipeptidase D